MSIGEPWSCRSPFTVGTGHDFAGIGAVGEFQPWSKLGDATLPRGERRFSEGAGDRNFWLRTVAPDGSPLFTPPAPGTFSPSQTRNTLNHPGFQNWNAAVFKNFAVREGHTLRFCAEYFNFPNHPNLGGVTTNPRRATF